MCYIEFFVWFIPTSSVIHLWRRLFSCLTSFHPCYKCKTYVVSAWHCLQLRGRLLMQTDKPGQTLHYLLVKSADHPPPRKHKKNPKPSRKARTELLTADRLSLDETWKRRSKERRRGSTLAPTPSDSCRSASTCLSSEQSVEEASLWRRVGSVHVQVLAQRPIRLIDVDFFEALHLDHLQPTTPTRPPS